MPLTPTFLDVSALTMGGTDFRGTLQSARFAHNINTVEGASITSRHDKPGKESMGCVLELTLMENVSGTNRAGHKNISGFTLGGTSYAGTLKSFTFNRTCSHGENMGDGTEWTYPVWKKNSTTISLELIVPLSLFPAYAAGLDVAAQAATELDFSITANGATLTQSAMIQSLNWEAAYDGEQVLTLELVGDAETSSPSGTGSLLAAAINAPETAIAAIVTTKSAGGITWAGDVLVSTARYSSRMGEKLMTELSYVSRGAWTATATT